MLDNEEVTFLLNQAELRLRSAKGELNEAAMAIDRIRRAF